MGIETGSGNVGFSGAYHKERQLGMTLTDFYSMNASNWKIRRLGDGKFELLRDFGERSKDTDTVEMTVFHEGVEYVIDSYYVREDDVLLHVLGEDNALHVAHGFEEMVCVYWLTDLDNDQN